MCTSTKYRCFTGRAVILAVMWKWHCVCTGSMTGRRTCLRTCSGSSKDYTLSCETFSSHCSPNKTQIQPSWSGIICLPFSSAAVLFCPVSYSNSNNTTDLACCKPKLQGQVIRCSVFCWMSASWFVPLFWTGSWVTYHLTGKQMGFWVVNSPHSK